MIYPIYTYGQDILRKKAEDIDLKDPNLFSLINDMYQTMHNANGAGLAAPQIGLNKKLVVVEDEISDGQIFKGVFINTNIIGYSGKMYPITEACLSFPELKIQIYRPDTVYVEWYDENKVYYKGSFDGIKSRIIQHEFDHLNGTLFIDRMDSVDKLNIFMKLEDIKNKKIKTLYAII